MRTACGPQNSLLSSGPTRSRQNAQFICIFSCRDQDHKSTLEVVEDIDIRGEWLQIFCEPLLFCCTVFQMAGDQRRVVVE